MSKSPWRHGDLNDTVLKFAELGADPIVKAFETIREILVRLDGIEAETARLAAASEMSKQFRKFHEQQQR